MSEFYNIPSVDISELEKQDFAIEKAYEKADYSAMIKEYPQKYENFNKFLMKNDII